MGMWVEQGWEGDRIVLGCKGREAALGTDKARGWARKA